MAIQLTSEQKALFADTQTIKVLTTVDGTGKPHGKIDRSIHLADDGTIVYLELLESSKSNHNLVESIWFDRSVSVLVLGDGERCIEVTGKPVRVHITGPIFERYYVDVRSRLGDVDLSGVWIIVPEQVTDENFWSKKAREESERPFFRHLDRLAKPDIYSSN